MTTPLVQHSSQSSLAGAHLSLVECFGEDIKFARRKSTVPVLGKLVHERIQFFYIKPVEAACPSELMQRVNRDVKESAMHLPATTESLIKLQRMIDTVKTECTLRPPEIRYFDLGSDSDRAIIYSIHSRF